MGNVYLLTHGIRPYLDARLGLASFFDDFERHSGAIYISRPTKPVMLISNTIKENIGFFGGAVSINSPNFAAADDSEANSSTSATVPAMERPYVVLYENDFSRNMAYMSGNSVFIQGTKRGDTPLQACNTGLLADLNTFRDNFGFKISDGGAISLVCSEVLDENEANFLRSSGMEA